MSKYDGIPNPNEYNNNALKTGASKYPNTVPKEVKITTEDDDTWGDVIGSTIGGLIGGGIGFFTPIPGGTIIGTGLGAAKGSYWGQYIEDKFFDNEEDPDISWGNVAFAGAAGALPVPGLSGVIKLGTAGFEKVAKLFGKELSKKVKTLSPTQLTNFIKDIETNVPFDAIAKKYGVPIDKFKKSPEKIRNWIKEIRRVNTPTAVELEKKSDDIANFLFQAVKREYDKTGKIMSGPAIDQLKKKYFESQGLNSISDDVIGQAVGAELIDKMNKRIASKINKFKVGAELTLQPVGQTARGLITDNKTYEDKIMTLPVDHKEDGGLVETIPAKVEVVQEVQIAPNQITKQSKTDRFGNTSTIEFYDNGDLKRKFRKDRYGNIEEETYAENKEPQEEEVVYAQDGQMLPALQEKLYGGFYKQDGGYAYSDPKVIWDMVKSGQTQPPADMPEQLHSRFYEIKDINDRGLLEHGKDVGLTAVGGAWDAIRGVNTGPIDATEDAKMRLKDIGVDTRNIELFGEFGLDPLALVGLPMKVVSTANRLLKAGKVDEAKNVVLGKSGGNTQFSRIIDYPPSGITNTPFQLVDPKKLLGDSKIYKQVNVFDELDNRALTTAIPKTFIKKGEDQYDALSRWTNLPRTERTKLRLEAEGNPKFNLNEVITPEAQLQLQRMIFDTRTKVNQGRGAEGFHTTTDLTIYPKKKNDYFPFGGQDFNYEGLNDTLKDVAIHGYHNQGYRLRTSTHETGHGLQSLLDRFNKNVISKEMYEPLEDELAKAITLGRLVPEKLVDNKMNLNFLSKEKPGSYMEGEYKKWIDNNNAAIEKYRSDPVSIGNQFIDRNYQMQPGAIRDEGVADYFSLRVNDPQTAISQFPKLTKLFNERVSNDSFVKEFIKLGEDKGMSISDTIKAGIAFGIPATALNKALGYTAVKDDVSNDTQVFNTGGNVGPLGNAGGYTKSSLGNENQIDYGNKSQHPGGPKGIDTIPAWLAPGEFVQNQESTAIFGDTIELMNDIGLAMRERGYQPDKPNYMTNGGKPVSLEEFKRKRPPLAGRRLTVKDLYLPHGKLVGKK